MKGLILAGGTGSRLYPCTVSVSKHLMPIFDKPMIYYPLSVLMLSGIRDVLIITTPDDLNNYQHLLGNGKKFGINLQYAIQPSPDGLAQAFLIGEEFIGEDPVCLVLGDNIFYGLGLVDILQKSSKLTKGANIFGYEVKDPENFGIAEVDRENKVLSIEEKPKNPKSNLAIVGLYFFDNNVIEFAKEAKPSKRGELEITSIHQAYLDRGELNLKLLGRGFDWLDTGTPTNLLAAANFVENIQYRHGFKIACLEEIGLKNGWLQEEEIFKHLSEIKDVEYVSYLYGLIKENKENIK